MPSQVVENALSLCLYISPSLSLLLSISLTHPTHHPLAVLHTAFRFHNVETSSVRRRFLCLSLSLSVTLSLCLSVSLSLCLSLGFLVESFMGASYPFRHDVSVMCLSVCLSVMSCYAMALLPPVCHIHFLHTSCPPALFWLRRQPLVKGSKSIHSVDFPRRIIA